VLGDGEDAAEGRAAAGEAEDEEEDGVEEEEEEEAEGTEVAQAPPARFQAAMLEDLEAAWKG